MSEGPVAVILGLLVCLVFLAMFTLVPVAVLGALIGPARIAVRRMLARRFRSPLERGRLEWILVLFAATGGACCAVVDADLIGRAVPGDGWRQVGQLILLILAPAPLGAI